jgi:hypothetical protein
MLLWHHKWPAAGHVSNTLSRHMGIYLDTNYSETRIQSFNERIQQPNSEKIIDLIHVWFNQLACMCALSHNFHGHVLLTKIKPNQTEN